MMKNILKVSVLSLMVAASASAMATQLTPESDDLIPVTIIPRKKVIFPDVFVFDNDTSAPHRFLTKDRLDHCVNHATAAYNNKDAVAKRKELQIAGHIMGEFSLENGTPSGIITYKNGNLVVAFHGTEPDHGKGLAMDDFATDISAWKKAGKTIGLEGYVHGGILDRYLGARSNMVYTIQSLLLNNGIDLAAVKNIEVTGHSLGGGLSHLAAFDLKKNMFSDINVKLVTFNSPRVFDNESAKQVTKTMGESNIIRIFRKGDVVSAVSTGTGLLGYVTGFKHVGIKLALEKVSSFNPLSNHWHSNNAKDILDKTSIEINKFGGGVKTQVKHVTKSFTNSVKSGLRWFDKTVLCPIFNKPMIQI